MDKVEDKMVEIENNMAYQDDNKESLPLFCCRGIS